MGTIKDDLEGKKEERDRVRGLAGIAKQRRTEGELRRLVRSLATEVDELRRDLEISLGTEGYKPIKIKLPKNKKSGTRSVTPLAIWSDWHIEEIVDPVSTNGRNIYNPEIARKRFENLIEHTAWLIQREAKTHRIDEIIVGLLGDFMSGHIHEDLIEVTATAPLETAFIIHQWLIDGLLYVADQTKIQKIFVPTSWGNHGRITSGRPRIATAAHHNIEQLIFRSIARDLKDDKRFVFDTSPTAFKYISLGDNYTIRFNHGDTFKFRGGTAGLTAPFHNALRGWEQETHADLTCVGHWHQRLDLKMGLFNGSLIGASEYSRRFGFEVPSQTLAFIDRDRGLKAGVYPIFVE